LFIISFSEATFDWAEGGPLGLPSRYALESYQWLYRPKGNAIHRDVSSPTWFISSVIRIQNLRRSAHSAHRSSPPIPLLYSI